MDVLRMNNETRLALNWHREYLQRMTDNWLSTTDENLEDCRNLADRMERELSDGLCCPMQVLGFSWLAVDWLDIAEYCYFYSLNVTPTTNEG